MSHRHGSCNFYNCARLKGAIAHHFRQLEALLSSQNAGDNCVGHSPCCARQQVSCQGDHQHSLCRYHGHMTSAFNLETFGSNTTSCLEAVDTAISDTLRSLSDEQSSQATQNCSTAVNNLETSFTGDFSSMTTYSDGLASPHSNQGLYPTPIWASKILGSPNTPSDVPRSPSNSDGKQSTISASSYLPDLYVGSPTKSINLDSILSDTRPLTNLSPALQGLKIGAPQGFYESELPRDTPSNSFGALGHYHLDPGPSNFQPPPLGDIISLPELDLNASELGTLGSSFRNDSIAESSQHSTSTPRQSIRGVGEAPAETSTASSDSEFDVPRDIHKMGHRDDNGRWRCSRKGCTSDRVFKRACDLRKHWRSHERKHSCDYPDCAIAFTSAKDLRRHQASHDPAVKCPASGCERVFSRSDNMRDHFRRIHKDDRLQRTGLVFRNRISK